jgi:hypothetical protein
VQLARCARGATGSAEIRGGRRRVPLGPVGALSFFFDLAAAAGELPLVQAVLAAESLEAARRALLAIGLSTELDYEIDRAAAGG